MRFAPSVRRLIAIGFLCPAASWAAETISTTSGRQDPLDNTAGGARPAALGSAFVAVADDVNAIYWNPAGLSNLNQSEIALQHGSWFGSNQETLLYGVPLKKLGGLGISGSYTGYGTFDGRDEQGASTGGYNADQLDLGAAWGGRVVGNLSLGVALRGVQQTLAEQSYSLFTGGVGALVMTPAGWRIGVSYMNGGLTKNSSAASSSFRAGFSRDWILRGGWSLLAAVGGDLAPASGNSVQAGFEGSYRSTYFIRLGYDQRFQTTGLTGMYGPTAGLGLALGSLRLDYAYVPYGELGGVNQLVLSYRFGSVAQESKSPVSKAPAAMPPSQPVTVYVPVPATGNAAPNPEAAATPQAATANTTAGANPLVMNFEEAGDALAAARQMVKEGRAADAAKAYMDILRKDSQNAQAWWDLGNLYYRAGQKEYAVRCFDSVLQLQPGNQALADWLKTYKGP